MKKPDSLRAALTQAFPDEFSNDAARLSLWIEEGHVRCHAGADIINYSVEYKLCVAIAGWRLSSLLIWVVLIDWLRVQQPDLLTWAQSRKAIPFEADLISNVEADVGFDLMLTEAVRVTRREDGGFNLMVIDEPDPLFPDAAPLLCSAPLLKQIWAPGLHPEQIAPDPRPMAELEAIEPFLHELMDGLEPSRRKRLIEKLMRLARRANAKRISANLTPEGQRMAPRKQVRPGQRKKMFTRIGKQNSLRIRATADEGELRFANGLIQDTAATHHFGLVGFVGSTRQGRVIRTKYQARELLGFGREQSELLDEALNHLTLRNSK